MHKRPIHRRIALAVCAGSTLLAGMAFGQDDTTVNRMLASQCFQCHGYNGNALGDIDSLAGESRGEISEEMLEARWESASGIMDHQALGYTDDQIRRLGDFFASVDRFRDPDLQAPLSPPDGSGGGGDDNEMDEPDEQDEVDEPDERDEVDDPDERDEADEDDEEDRDSWKRDEDDEADEADDERRDDKHWRNSEEESRSWSRDEDDEKDEDEGDRRRRRRHN